MRPDTYRLRLFCTGIDLSPGDRQYLAARSRRYCSYRRGSRQPVSTAACRIRVGTDCSVCQTHVACTYTGPRSVEEGERHVTALQLVNLSLQCEHVHVMDGQVCAFVQVSTLSYPPYRGGGILYIFIRRLVDGSGYKNSNHESPRKQFLIH